MNIKNPVPEIVIFNVVTVDDQLENDFYAFFYKYDLDAIFTDAHRTDNIKVTDNDLRAVVNTGGAYHQPLKELGDLLAIASDNDSYQEAMFRLIDEPKTFQKMMNYVKKLNAYIKNKIFKDGYEHNTWNIVWYNKDLKSK